jgi:uncharacterized protein
MAFPARHIVIACLAGIIATAGIAAEQAQPSLAAIAGKRSAAPAKHLIWRASKDGRAVAFLVGSLHVLSKHSYPLPPAFDEVYSATSILLEEIDLGAMPDASSAARIAEKTLLTGGQSLTTVLDETTYARVSAKAASTGLPMAFLDRMKPWLVAMTLMVPDLQAAGFDPNYGIDRHFYARAKADARPVRGLETLDDQLGRLNDLAMPVQVDMLRAMLDDVDTQIKSVSQLITAWRTGDVPTLETLLLKEFRESPEVYQRLLVERNRNWLPAISSCQASAACLVVVGSAHLIGDDSVVALLSKAGFTVEQQ